MQSGHTLNSLGLVALDRAQLQALLRVGFAHENGSIESSHGDAWLAKGANILLFGPPGGGKSHLSAALELALIENGRRVKFARTTDLVHATIKTTEKDED